MKWEPFDSSWLIDLAVAQLPKEKWLPAALEKCIRGHWTNRGYVVFVPKTEWNWKRNVLLYDKQKGEMVLDVLEGNRIGAIEFLSLISAG